MAKHWSDKNKPLYRVVDSKKCKDCGTEPMLTIGRQKFFLQCLDPDCGRMTGGSKTEAAAIIEWDKIN